MNRAGIYLNISSKEFDNYHRIRERLQEPIEASSNQDLEVALVSFSYPNTWYTVDEKCKFDVVINLWKSAFLGLTQLEPVPLRIPITIEPTHRNLDLDQDFLQSLNQTVAAAIDEKLVRFRNEQVYLSHIHEQHLTGSDYWNISYNEECNRVLISDPSIARRVEPEPTQIANIEGTRLWRILGFGQFALGSSSVAHALPVEAETGPTVASHVTLLNIYAPNFIRDQRYGDTFRPLLEIIPVAVGSNVVKYHTLNTYTQTNPNYKRLLRGYINEIVIDIRDENNQLIPLISGKINLILHIRPCRSHWFQGR